MPNGVRHLAKRQNAAYGFVPTFLRWDCLIGAWKAPSGLRPLTFVRGDRRVVAQHSGKQPGDR